MFPQNVLSGFNLQKKTEIHLESFGKKVLLFLRTLLDTDIRTIVTILTMREGYLL